MKCGFGEEYRVVVKKYIFFFPFVLPLFLLYKALFFQHFSWSSDLENEVVLGAIVLEAPGVWREDSH